MGLRSSIMKKFIFSNDNILNRGSGMIATLSDNFPGNGEMAWWFKRETVSKWRYASFFFPENNLLDFSVSGCGKHMTKSGGPYNRENFPPDLMFNIACKFGLLRNNTIIHHKEVLRQFEGFKKSPSNPNLKVSFPEQLNLF